MFSSPPQPAQGPVTVYRPTATGTVLPSGYYVGSGLLGQPTLYTSGQPVRNFLRYLSP